MRNPNGRSAVNLMLASTFLLWFSLYTYPSFLAVYAQKAGAAPVMVGAIVGSYGLLQMILRLPLGFYSDMIKRRKPFMLIGMLASLVSALGFFFLKSPAGMLAARSMAGVAATTWVSYSVLYASLFDDRELTAAMGRISSVQYGSQLLAMLLGGYLAQHLGYGSAFLLAFASGAAGIILVLKIRDRVPDVRPQSIRSLVHGIKDKKLLVSTGLSVVFHFVCWGTILGFTASWASDVVGMDNAQLGLLSAMYLLPNLFVPPLAGALSKRFGLRKVIATGFLIDAAACALFVYCKTPASLYGVQALFGLGMALMLPLFISGAIADIGGAQRGAAMGFYQSVYGVGMFLGPLAAGGVIQRFSNGGLILGYTANFRFMAGVSLIGMALSLIFYRRGD